MRAAMARLGGDPKKSVLARFGATHNVGGVGISTVPAVHSNGVSPGLIGGPIGEAMAAAGIVCMAKWKATSPMARLVLLNNAAARTLPSMICQRGTGLMSSGSRDCRSFSPEVASIAR